MTLLSSKIKKNILTKLLDIINIEDLNWSNLSLDLKFKIIHNLCNYLKNSVNFKSSKELEYNETNNNLINTINIPLKNQRPKKIIELSGINKQSNSELFEEFRKKFILINKEFRKKYNQKNKYYCYANLSDSKYKSILSDYNQNVFDFINKNINKIDTNKFFNNLIGGNNNKIINITNNVNSNIKINKISYIDEFINIEFDNQVIIILQLYLTSEKITSNIPAKYKLYLTNIF